MRVIKFIGFKIAEISGAVLFVYGSYHLWNYLLINVNTDWVELSTVVKCLVGSLYSFATLATIGMIIWGLIVLVKKNWEWAE